MPRCWPMLRPSAPPQDIPLSLHVEDCLIASLTGRQGHDALLLICAAMASSDLLMTFHREHVLYIPKDTPAYQIRAQSAHLNLRCRGAHVASVMVLDEAMIPVVGDEVAGEVVGDEGGRHRATLAHFSAHESHHCFGLRITVFVMAWKRNS